MSMPDPSGQSHRIRLPALSEMSGCTPTCGSTAPTDSAVMPTDFQLGPFRADMTKVCVWHGIAVPILACPSRGAIHLTSPTSPRSPGPILPRISCTLALPCLTSLRLCTSVTPLKRPPRSNKINPSTTSSIPPLNRPSPHPSPCGSPAPARSTASTTALAGARSVYRVIARAR
jgi:hypothetical protein